MAGRGTDIILGGNPEFQARLIVKQRKGGEAALPVADPTPDEEIDLEEVRTEVEKRRPAWQKEHEEVVTAGGLHIIGTERHEARRIDNQLRGRAGRQGDPGSSRFYLSLEDDLMRIFGSDNISGLMQRLGMEENVPIESRLITRQIERAQKQVEARNFEIRKHLLEYDDVMNKQREEIYRFRRELLEGKDQKEYILGLAEDLTREFLDTYAGEDVLEENWDLDNLKVNMRRVFGIDIPDEIDVPPPEGDPGAANRAKLKEVSRPELEDYLLQRVQKTYQDKEDQVGEQSLRWFERVIMLQTIDQQWKDHLLMLDHVKEGIGLRGYGQRDPLVEYKRESFTLFEELWNRATEEMVRMVYLLKPVSQEEEKDLLGAKARRQQQQQQAQRATYSAGMDETADTAAAERRTAAAVKTAVRTVPKVGRNEPCPCGSGKKYKKCCGT
jgi:preprotein translocase subunit SecA